LNRASNLDAMSARNVAGRSFAGGSGFGGLGNRLGYSNLYGGLGYGGLGYGGLGYGCLGYGGLGYGGLGYGGLGYGGLGYGGLGYGGLGYGGLGYGGLGGLGLLGLGGLGLGYGGLFGLGSPLMGLGGYGLGGYGGGYGGYGYGGYGGYGGGYASNADSQTDPHPAATDFATMGDQAFQEGRYDDAIHDWQHSLVDDPQNGGLLLLMGQAFFAKGDFDQAAGAVQQGMHVLPQDKWGAVVQHYQELYPDNGTFTSQLRALEAARSEKPDAPALRFLLGYEYAYLGYPKQAVRELDKATELNSNDQLARQLRDLAKGMSETQGSVSSRG
jgi:hypothetical protein